MLNPKVNKNKIILSSIRILLPNLDKSYYISIIVNETKPIKTKLLEFKNSINQCEITQSFELDPSIESINTIKFEMFEKSNIFANPLYKCEINCDSQIKDNHTGNLVGYLKNSNGENYAVIYYNFEFSSEDIFLNFEKNKEKFSAMKEVSIINLNKGLKSRTYQNFLENVEYLKILLANIEKIIKWENTWKTMSILLFISLTILWPLYIILIFLPFGLIFFHLISKNHIEKFYIIKTDQLNTIDNTNFTLGIMDYYNMYIDKYKSFISKIMTGDNAKIEFYYKNILKLFIFNIVAYCLIITITIRFFMLFLLWKLFLSYNPTYVSFKIFLQSLVKSKMGYIFKNQRIMQLYIGIINIIYWFIPFYSQYDSENITEEKKDIVGKFRTSNTPSNDSQPPVPLKRSENVTENNKVVKIELYENERWWVVIGWAKNLILNEIPLWCRVDNMTKFCNKEMVFPPSGNYQWVGDWKVEIKENTDDEGWEYANDFHSTFTKTRKGKYVRRRKWIRYAT